MYQDSDQMKYDVRADFFVRQIMCMERNNMENQKLENLLNLSLDATMSEREKSRQLEVGFLPLENRWELIVKHNGSLADVANELIRVEELIAGYAIVTLPEALINSFAELPEVEYVEKPKRLYFSVLEGKQASCIPEVTVREPYLNGNGVLLAVLDSGLDYRSPEFQKMGGKTRIRYLWDQTLTAEDTDERLPEGYEQWQSSAPPEGFRQGVLFTEERINAALQSSMPLQIVPSVDTSGHGTAVTAIAAGSGNYMGGQLQGVAPEAELLIVKLGNPSPDSFPKTTELMRGLTFAVKTALREGKPLVINLSFGNTYGVHDGTSLLERFLDNIAEIGRCAVCVGSGNEGASGGHTSGSFVTMGDSTSGNRQTGGSYEASRLIELGVGDYQPSFSVQLWKEYTDQFRLSIRSPGGQQITLNSEFTGAVRYRLESTELLIYQGEPTPYSVRQEFYVDFIPDGSYVNRGVWSFLLEPVKIVGGSYDFYLPVSSVLSADTAFFMPTAERTLTIPSTASRVITVGAYDPYTEAYADFSGRGASVSDVTAQKPDLAAPGVNVTTLGPGNIPVVVSGTSFATPFVSGSAALLMEWGIVRGNDPFLYGEKLKAYLRRGARTLRGGGELPNNRVGYGALCLAQSIPE